MASAWRDPLSAAVIVCALAAGPAVQAAPFGAAPVAGAPTDSANVANPALQIGELSERLFEAVTASDWPRARLALQSLHDQARLVNGPFEQGFLAAGGDINALIKARNAMAGVLAEADIALDAKEASGLSNVASRLTTIAGELATPFAEAPGASLPLRVYAATFQSRRMLDALKWSDGPGYALAHARFRRLWQTIRSTPGLDRDKVMVLDRALASAALSRSDQTAHDLQVAADNIIGELGHPVPRAP